MADEQTVIEETITEEKPTTSQLLQAAAFDKPAEQPQITNEQVQTQATPIAEAKKVEEEILDPKDWLKREFQVDDADILRQQIKEYNELKAKGTEGIKFANEQSKQLHELIREGKTKEVKNFIETQEQLEILSSVDVNKDTAADIIKLQIKLKNPQLDNSEVEFQYKQNYVAPKEPVQRATETDEEFEERKSEWDDKVQAIETNRVIAAKMAQPELVKLKSELVLPDISPKEVNSNQQQLSQEDLLVIENQKKSFLQSAETIINSFNGFTVPVKDKDVDYSVNYAPSLEEKTFVSNKIKDFAESGFDANALLAERWVAEDGKTLKVEQMVKDLSRIYGDEKITQKLALDSANKRLESYLKDKKQINVNETNQSSTFSPSDNLTEMDKVREQAFA